MLTPGIEIRWGNRDDAVEGLHAIRDPEQRAVLRPKVQELVDIATDGLAEFGVELTDRKRVVVHAIEPGVPYVADAPTSKLINLYLKPGQAKGRLDTGYWARTVLHEGLHCVWQEGYAIKTLGELAATEGISYLADYLFYDHVTSWRDSRRFLVDTVNDLPKREQNTLKRNFMSVQDIDLTEKSAEKWLTCRQPPGARNIDIIGIIAVSARINEGYEISDLLTITPEQILGHEPGDAAA